MRLSSQVLSNPGTESDTGDGLGTLKVLTTNTPEGYNELFVHWIDTDIKEETKAAEKAGQHFQPEINFYKQFATP